MDDRPAAAKLTAAIALMAFGLAACGAPPAPKSTAKPVATVPAAQAEAALRTQAAAMQRTILEGALAGAAVGGGLQLAFGDERKARRSATLGFLAGATAGTYVAYVQRRYFGKEKRLRAIKADLDRNAAEMRTTISVMQQVLAVQRQELAAVKARLKAGTATSADIQAELGQARANLGEMQKAIDGATKRQGEFGQARGLTLISGGASSIDGDLASLAQQIAAMKAIAADLSSEL